MAYKKGTKLIQIPVTTDIYNELKIRAEKDILTKTVPKMALKIIVEYLENKKNK
jgi:hypothetical protein